MPTVGVSLHFLNLTNLLPKIMTLKSFSLEAADELVLRYPALSALREPVVKSVEILCASIRGGGKILTCGNGGSASDAEHIVGELVKSFILPRPITPKQREQLEQSDFADWETFADKLQQGIPAIALTGHPALSTAVSNDIAPELVFAQQAYVYGRPGDAIIGLSTSGNSKNVVNALKVARAFGLKTIGFTGSKPAQMDALCDVIIKVPAEETFKIQEFHLPVYHTFCIMIERELFS